jgi:hypothetical protein
MGWDDRGKGDDVRAWDIPEETDEVADPVLQVSRACGMSESRRYCDANTPFGCDDQNKVNTYLQYKLERGQHINTTLLSSTAFANPHIYSKLVSPDCHTLSPLIAHD